MNDKNLTQSHHSRIYDNFLMHWKYIKREKVDGKWRYTYEDDNSAASQIKRDTMAAEKKASAEAEQKEVEAYEFGVKASQNIFSAGVLNDVSESMLDEIALDATVKLYPNMSLKEFRGFSREQKQVLACALYATMAKESGVDPVTYAKNDISVRSEYNKTKAAYKDALDKLDATYEAISKACSDMVRAAQEASAYDKKAEKYSNSDNSLASMHNRDALKKTAQDFQRKTKELEKEVSDLEARREQEWNEYNKASTKYGDAKDKYEKKLEELHGVRHGQVDDNFLMHWKYIKREKVGNKWKYYYDDGTKTGDAAYEAKSAAERVKSKLDLVNSTIDNRNKAILDKNKKIVDAKMEQKALVDKNRQRIAEGKVTIDTSYERGKAKNTQLTAEYRKELLMEEKTALEKRKAELEAEVAKLEKEASDLEKQYNQSPAAKGYSTVDKVKDALGVDERAEYKKAKAKYEKAETNRINASRNADNAIKAYTELPRRYDESEYKHVSQQLHDSVSSHTFWKETAYERGKEYSAAKSEYMKTPLGTALKATEAIKDIPFEVEYALEKLAKKFKKK